jgi:serine/threonine-protein kinase
MLTGRPPFSGENVNAIMYQTLNASPPQPSSLNPEVPDMLNFIVAKALAKKTDERYQNAQEFANDLRACRDSLPHEAPAGVAVPKAQPLPLREVALPAGPVMTEDDENVPMAALGLSGAFDSMAATLRLAAMTNDEAEVEELSKTLRMSRPDMGELKPPAPPRPKPVVSPAPPPVRQPVAALEDNDGDEDESGGSGNLLLIAIIVFVVVGVILFVLF